MSRSEFLFADDSMGKNVIIFEADMNCSVHINKKGKDILILREEPKNYKYFVGYFYNGSKVKPLLIMLLKTSACVKR